MLRSKELTKRQDAMKLAERLKAQNPAFQGLEVITFDTGERYALLHYTDMEVIKNGIKDAG